ncbi:MAG: hypothetical protein IJ343_08420 [Clostridia bacterium]|nr:hypothetical protein [Clostridia bacterium]
MKRVLTLLLTTLLLGGCTALPAEERSFAVALGVTHADDLWTAHARIPTYQTGGGYATVTGEGPTLESALGALDAASPMELDLGQLRLLVFSAELARSEAFPGALTALSGRHDLRMGAALAVTQEDVRALMDALTPTTGSRLSKSIDVLLETRIGQGALLPASLAEVMRMGERQSPVMMNAGLESGALSLSGAWPLNTEGLATAPLSPEDTRLLSLMLGRLTQGTLSLPEGTVRLSGAKAEAELLQPTLQEAAVRLTLQVVSSSLTEEALSRAVATACLGVLGRLSGSGCDALGLGRQAVVHAQDMAQWHDFDWPARYRDVVWSVSVGVAGPAR